MVKDLCRVPLAVNDVETDACEMELLDALHEVGIEPGGFPDQEAVDAIGSWAVIEHRRHCRCSTIWHDDIPGETHHPNLKDNEDSDHEDTTGSRTLEEKLQSPIVEGLAVDIGDDEFLRDSRQFRKPLITSRSEKTTFQASHVL